MKQFVANRSGATPTLDEVNNTKVKVYTNEAAIDADLANLEVGQIVGTTEQNITKLDVDKQWVRNQNRLSAIEAVTLSASSSAPTVIVYDGFLIVKIAFTSNNGTATRHLYVNGTDIVSQSISQYAVQRTEELTLPVNKGDEIYVSDASAYEARGMFFKLRDYSDRS